MNRERERERFKGEMENSSLALHFTRCWTVVHVAEQQPVTTEVWPVQTQYTL